MRNLTIAIAIFLTVSLLFVVPSTAQTNTITEAFDNYSAGVYPPIPSANRIPGWTYGSAGTHFGVELVSTPAVTGQSVKVTGYSFGINGAINSLHPVITTNSIFSCDGNDSQSFSFAWRTTALPSVTGGGQSVGALFRSATDNSYFAWLVGNSGASSAVVSTSTGAQGSVTLSGAALTANEWWLITFYAFNCDDEAFAVTKQKLADNSGFGTASVNANNLAGVMTPPSIIETVQSATTGGGGGSSASVGDTFYDNLTLVGFEGGAVLPSPDSNQVAVTDLTGYSMDAGARNIIVRVSGGDVVATYGVADLLQISTATDADCASRSDGVNAALYNSEVWMTYVECREDGQSAAFIIRDYSLNVPEFPCDEATGDVTNNDEIDVPNHIGDIGTISDLNPSYIGRCGDAGFDDASVGWTFNTIGGAGIGGRIGAFGVVYNSGVLLDRTDTEYATLDTSASPSINQFCSWQTDGGRDFIGAVTDNGPTAIYEVVSSVNQQEGSFGKEIDVDLDPKFNNGGTYANAAGIACANDVAVIQLSSAVHVLLNVTSAPTIAPGWPKSISNSHERGVAITGSGEFIAINSNNQIHVYALNGTETSDPMTEPAGTWRGMEFDHSGENLAVFTSSLITVFETEEVTCGTVGNCAELGNLEEEGGPECPNPPCATTTTTSSGSAVGGGVLGLSGTTSIIASLATIVGFLLLGAAILSRRGSGNNSDGDDDE